MAVCDLREHFVRATIANTNGKSEGLFFGSKFIIRKVSSTVEKCFLIVGTFSLLSRALAGQSTGRNDHASFRSYRCPHPTSPKASPSSFIIVINVLIDVACIVSLLQRNSSTKRYLVGHIIFSSKGAPTISRSASANEIYRLPSRLHLILLLITEHFHTGAYFWTTSCLIQSPSLSIISSPLVSLLARDAGNQMYVRPQRTCSPSSSSHCFSQVWLSVMVPSERQVSALATNSRTSPADICRA